MSFSVSNTSKTSSHKNNGTTIKTIKPFHISNHATSSYIPNGIPQYFSGLQILSSYNVPVIQPVSKKTTIAIVIAYSYSKLLDDLKTYWQSQTMYGPNSTVPKVNVHTMPGATFNNGWAQEECLDLQMVCTINPNANIWVVEARSASFKDLLEAIDYATNVVKADVISMSWGANDDGKIPLSYMSRFMNTGVSYCASSGDSNTASWPAVLPNCIAVGGTTLNMFSNYRSEYTWTSAGSGHSTSITQPSYQAGVTGINSKKRIIPDVSLIANPNTSVYVVYKGSWSGVGGTSVAAPIFAGMVSLFNQMRFNNGKGPLTTVESSPSNIQTYLYKTILPNPLKYSTTFNDIVTGTNKGSSVNGNTMLLTYSTQKGYDIPTGLGSPNCSALCNELNNL